MLFPLNFIHLIRLREVREIQISMNCQNQFLFMLQEKFIIDIRMLVFSARLSQAMDLHRGKIAHVDE